MFVFYDHFINRRWKLLCDARETVISAKFTVMATPIQLQQLSLDLQNIQADLSKAIEARQRLDAQLSENELVQKEFALLKPENVVYKQIGPVLVVQDQEDAKQNVATRLNFIRGEIKWVETQLKQAQTNADQKKREIASIQGALQQQAQAQLAPPS